MSDHHKRHDSGVATKDEQAAESPATGEVADPESPDDLVIEDLLVEEVSIDGMCGVY